MRRARPGGLARGPTVRLSKKQTRENGGTPLSCRRFTNLKLLSHLQNPASQCFGARKPCLRSMAARHVLGPNSTDVTVDRHRPLSQKRRQKRSNPNCNSINRLQFEEPIRVG